MASVKPNSLYITLLDLANYFESMDARDWGGAYAGTAGVISDFSDALEAWSERSSFPMRFSEGMRREVIIEKCEQECRNSSRAIYSHAYLGGYPKRR